MISLRKRRAPCSVRKELKRVPICNSQDIVSARQEGRLMASRLRFSASDLTLITTAISEVARNILDHARQGEIVFDIVKNHTRQALVVEAWDRGPGIPDVSRALQVGYSSRGGLGLGLPGARRLMDDFTIASTVGKGTVVRMKKWAPL
jgi:serine/threonine-protein kinase RsbT